MKANLLPKHITRLEGFWRGVMETAHDQHIRKYQISDAMGMHRSSFDDMVKAGRYPSIIELWAIGDLLGVDPVSLLSDKYSYTGGQLVRKVLNLALEKQVALLEFIGEEGD